MKQKKLKAPYLSALCLEFALLMRAGITLGEGLSLMIEEDDDRRSRALLQQLSQYLEEGSTVADAFEKAGVFPDYMVHMTRIGEQTGRPVEAFEALSKYYEEQQRLSEGIRNALLYPAVLLVMMLAVLVVLITQVLPIFEDVFTQMGSSMPDIAKALVQFGRMLSGAWMVFVIILGVLILFGIAVAAIQPFRAKCGELLRGLMGNRGFGERMFRARFAGAMSMGMASGLPLEESIKLAGALSGGTKAQRARPKKCLELLEQGATLSTALQDSGIFQTVYCRMLALAQRSGSADSVMEEIARRLEEDTQDHLASIVGRVEPTLVVLTSLMVGVILLSVMLPLMNIMSTLG